MKRLVSILSILIILFSGMNLTLATHYCSGEVADIKVSFLPVDVSCGMEKSEDDCQGHSLMSSGCCRNEFAFYNVEDDFYPQQISTIFLPLQVTLLFSTLIDKETAEVGNSLFSLKYSSFADLLPDEVKQEEVCVFII